jgi:glutaredoxin
MYTTIWRGDCRLAKRMLASCHVTYVEVDVEDDRRAAALLLLSGGMLSVPTILFPDGSWLVKPSVGALEAKLRAIGGCAS